MGRICIEILAQRKIGNLREELNLSPNRMQGGLEGEVITLVLLAVTVIHCLMILCQILVSKVIILLSKKKVIIKTFILFLPNGTP